MNSQLIGLLVKLHVKFGRQIYQLSLQCQPLIHETVYIPAMMKLSIIITLSLTEYLTPEQIPVMVIALYSPGPSTLGDDHVEYAWILSCCFSLDSSTHSGQNSFISCI